MKSKHRGRKVICRMASVCLLGSSEHCPRLLSFYDMKNAKWIESTCRHAQPHSSEDCKYGTRYATECVMGAWFRETGISKGYVGCHKKHLRTA